MCCRRRDRRQADVHRTSVFRWVRIPIPAIKKSPTTDVVGDFLAEDEGFELRFSCVYGVFETFMFTKCRFYFSYPIIPNCSIQTNPLKGNLKGKNKGKQNCKQKNLLAILYLLGRGTIT